MWGKVSADIDAAKWAAMASKEDREATAQSLVATTASLYWQIGYLKQRLQLGQNNIDDAQQTLNLIQRQYELGAVDQLDVLEAKSSLASLQAQQSEFEQSLLEANNAFAILFNQPPQSMSDTIRMLPDESVPSLNVGVPADLLIRRPDVKAAIYDVKSALANKDAADLDYLPELTLTGALGGSSEALKDLLSNPVGTLEQTSHCHFCNGTKWRTTRLLRMSSTKRLSSITAKCCTPHSRMWRTHCQHAKS